MFHGKALRLVMGVFLVVLAGLFFSPFKAEAISLMINNRYEHDMAVAVVYFDDDAGKWRVRGWYNAPAHTEKMVHFNESAKSNKIWIHAYTSEATWGGDGDDVIKRTVISKAFNYIDGQTAPYGEGRREVVFSRYYAENDGVVRFLP